MSTSFSVRTIEFPSIAGVNQDGTPVALFTPSETGLYRITVCTEEVVLGEPSGADQIQYSYTDAAGDQSFPVGPIPPVSGSNLSNFFPVIMLHLIKETPVTYFFAGISSNVFNAYFVIEKLG